MTLRIEGWVTKSFRSGTHPKSSLLRELGPDSLPSRALHPWMQTEETVGHPLTWLVHSVEELENGMKPTLHRDKPNPKLLPKILLYRGGRDPRPSLHQPTRAPAARGAGDRKSVV